MRQRFYPRRGEPLRQFESAADRHAVYNQWKTSAEAPVPNGHFVIDGRLYAYGAAEPIVNRCRGCGFPLDKFSVPHDQQACVTTHTAEIRTAGRFPRRGDYHQTLMAKLRPAEMHRP